MSYVFEGLTFGQRIVLILQMAIMVSGIIFLIFKLVSNKSVSVNVVKGMLSYGPDSKDPQTLQHMASGVFFHTLETVAIMTQIKTKMILHDQMTYLEERLVIIRDNILDAYRQSWKKIANDNPKLFEEYGSQEYLFYQSLVSLLEEYMKSNVRAIFLRNHFSSYDEHQLNSYIKEKNEILLVTAYRFIRDMYPEEKMAIKFDDIEKGLDQVKEEIENSFTMVFKRAVAITNDRHEQIKDLESSLRNRIKNAYGVELLEDGVNVFSSAVQKGKNDGTESR